MRIRALKPGFFKNEDLCALSPFHRLCFEGLWCCADREGRLQDRPKRLKAEIFPYDDLNMDHLLWDLSRAGFIRRYQVEHQPYIAIPSWENHQHPRQDEIESTIQPYVAGSDRATTIGQILVSTPVIPTETDPSLHSDGPACRTRMGQVDLGQVDLGNGETAVPLRAPRCAQDLVDLWNTTTKPPLPQCRELTDERRRKIRARLKKRTLAEFQVVFDRLQASAFCRGEVPGRNGESPWVANFDWVIRNDTNAVKVLEGRYDDRAGPTMPRALCQHQPACADAWAHDRLVRAEASGDRELVASVKALHAKQATA